ncbi:C40 family peptidase [Streptosporangium sp. NBC_01755]|uniref:C40 family peptidase n=1 Tax=unclassified Streptosporangium TaxID=2632669 RepID=UPI002DDBF04D|nr:MULTISPECIES: C40 family peptidase [unclassified Streptosporangium]WSA26533.1 C40 family peptidase [Streptosporangium sp. NBC_01810]WSD02044.1 C40 family peptidase [Streptosporangium sp. NBC_01755]
MEGIILSGKMYSRVLSILVSGAAVFAASAMAPTAALAAAPLPSPESPALGTSTLKAALKSATPRPAWRKAVNWAMSKRGTPYVWGGTGNGGFDCSGLMLRAYGAAGITLPRVTNDQYAAFSKKIAWKDLKPGDLAFFSGLGHVGMITRPGYMVHAPRSGDVVKEEKLSAWRRSSFVGAVRPDPQGVKLTEQIKIATGG